MKTREIIQNSTDEKNKRLAELLGWTEITPCKDAKSRLGVVSKTSPQVTYHIPNYVGDLNAVRAVVVALPIEQQLSYREALIALSLLYKDYSVSTSRRLQLYIDANAEQRVDALILTLDLTI